MAKNKEEQTKQWPKTKKNRQNNDQKQWRIDKNGRQNITKKTEN
jgi:hypothetical protein